MSVKDSRLRHNFFAEPLHEQIYWTNLRFPGLEISTGWISCETWFMLVSFKKCLRDCGGICSPSCLSWPFYHSCRIRGPLSADNDRTCNFGEMVAKRSNALSSCRQPDLKLLRLKERNMTKCVLQTYMWRKQTWPARTSSHIKRKAKRRKKSRSMLDIFHAFFLQSWRDFTVCTKQVFFWLYCRHKEKECCICNQKEECLGR